MKWLLKERCTKCGGQGIFRDEYYWEWKCFICGKTFYPNGNKPGPVELSPNLSPRPTPRFAQDRAKQEKQADEDFSAMIRRLQRIDSEKTPKV